MGDFEALVPAWAESQCEIPPFVRLWPNLDSRHPGEGQFVSGSLTGAVSSKRVTEECKGRLSTDGNRVESARAQAGFTARQTCRAVTKVGSSDPAIPSGRVVAQRIKGTPGITG
ncbi:hypothetical protein JVX88_18495 [Leptolyngbya sp. 7M]|nr:hypothetical protein JVX88_18495 [Leptolyngbya sp. 7M]